MMLLDIVLFLGFIATCYFVYMYPTNKLQLSIKKFRQTINTATGNDRIINTVMFMKPDVQLTGVMTIRYIEDRHVARVLFHNTEYEYDLNDSTQLRMLIPSVLLGDR